MIERTLSTSRVLYELPSAPAMSQAADFFHSTLTPQNVFKDKKASAPPNFLICPKTQTLFSDPVLHSDGVTYERSALAQVTGQNPAALLSNFVIKAVAERWRDAGDSTWENIERELECPLTLEPLSENFVTCRDGWSYEGQAMTRYFARGGKLSPKTRQDLTLEPRALVNTNLLALVRLATSRHHEKKPAMPSIPAAVVKDAVVLELERLAKQPMRCAPCLWLDIYPAAEGLARRTNLRANSTNTLAIGALRSFCNSWYSATRNPDLFRRDNVLDALPRLIQLRYIIRDYDGARKALSDLRELDALAVMPLMHIVTHLNCLLARTLISQRRCHEALAFLQRSRPRQDDSEWRDIIELLFLAMKQAIYENLSAYTLDQLEAVTALHPAPTSQMLETLAQEHARKNNPAAAKIYFARATQTDRRDVDVFNGVAAARRPSRLRKFFRRLAQS